MTPTTPPFTTPKSPRPKGISELKIKRHILFLMMSIKIVTVLFLFNHLQSGGFSSEQFTSALGLLVPVLTAYTSLIFNDFVDHRFLREDTSPLVRRSFQWVVYVVFFIYGWVLWLLPDMKARGDISFQFYTNCLTLTESGLGIYVGYIVSELFKKPSSPPS